MNKLQSVRGTKDLYFEEALRFERIIGIAGALANRYDFTPYSTPIFEFTDVFKRTLGDFSDIVSKEMYNFEDRNGESLTLRPEFTAGIVRSVISNGLQQNFPLKLFSYGPVFRYERPQKARQRQFNQINFEHIGLRAPSVDAELISLAARLLDYLEVIEEVKLEINSLGDNATRLKYQDKLVKYLLKYENDLSDDSKTRLKKNPLRILDSKNEKDQEILADAPLISESYSSETGNYFDSVLALLDELNIHYEINERLVRGLDYYCDTCFEFTTTKLGAQGTVLAGGRYDGLFKIMGGPDTPAIGFAGGIERLSSLIENTDEEQNYGDNKIAVLNVSDEFKSFALQIAEWLRSELFRVSFYHDGNLAKKMKRANKDNIDIVIMIGEDEALNGKFKMKNMKTSEEEIISQDNLIEYLAQANEN